MHQAAIRMLSNNLNKIAVLTVTGMKNSGKSFFLNNLIGVEDAFQVNNTGDKDRRKGQDVLMWIFSEPIAIELNDGKRFDIYVIDT